MSQSAKSNAVSVVSHEEEDHLKSEKPANTLDAFLIGITIVIGGQIFSWNAGLAGGFWEALAGLLTTGFSYVCLILCMSEMASALPFSGGSYGFVRACIGPLFGFMIGSLEALQNIAYVSSAVVPFGQMLSVVFKTHADYEPIYWVLFYVTAIAINVAGGSTFWWTCRILGVISLSLVVLYIAATSQFGDFGTYAVPGSDRSFSMTDYLTYLPFSAWFFIGIESTPLAAVDCSNPSRQIPYGMTFCVITLFLTAIGVFFTTCSQSPGTQDLASAALPWSSGFQRLFNVTEEATTWLALPATYATGFGFMFAYGKQMSSMARSGLFPKVFQLRRRKTHSPYFALSFGSAVSIAGLFLVYYLPNAHFDDVFNICLLSSYTIYIFVFISFVSFKMRFTTLTRTFTNPLGLLAPIYGILFSLVGIISIVGFQDTEEVALTVLIGYLAMLFLYYYLYGYGTQKLSEEEQKIMFRAYVMNANAMKKRKNRGGVGNKSKASSSQSKASDSGSINDQSSVGLSVAVGEQKTGKVGFLAWMGAKTSSVAPEPVLTRNEVSKAVSEKERESDEEQGKKEGETRVVEQANASGVLGYPGKVNAREGLMRKSLTASISEKFKELVREIEFVPLLSEKERQEYEEVVVADMCGRLPREGEGDDKHTSTSLPLCPSRDVEAIGEGTVAIRAAEAELPV